MIVRHRGVREAVELREMVHIVPHFFIVGVEDVRAVFVHMDPFNVLRVNISRDLRPFVDDQALLPGFLCLLGEYSAVQPRAHDQIIIVH